VSCSRARLLLLLRQLPAIRLPWKRLAALKAAEGVAAAAAMVAAGARVASREVEGAEVGAAMVAAGAMGDSREAGGEGAAVAPAAILAPDQRVRLRIFQHVHSWMYTAVIHPVCAG